MLRIAAGNAADKARKVQVRAVIGPVPQLRQPAFKIFRQRRRTVAQDLQNVMHPIVQHRALEKSQIVVTGAQGSTIVDADGTTYLDAMAGLWCVNIGYGRAELADIAAEQMQQTVPSVLPMPSIWLSAPNSR